MYSRRNFLQYAAVAPALLAGPAVPQAFGFGRHRRVVACPPPTACCDACPTEARERFGGRCVTPNGGVPRAGDHGVEGSGAPYPRGSRGF